MKASPGLLLGFLAALTATTPCFAEEPALRDKTLVAWVSPSHLNQKGGSVLTLDDNASHFDGIVFGELAEKRWMAGSDFYRRTERNQSQWPEETVTGGPLVFLAITYQANTLTLYRDGKVVHRHRFEQPQEFGSSSGIVIGPRHVGNRDCFAGQIADARIYDRSLTPEELAQLKPKLRGAIAPWAWWNFDGDSPREQTGRFPATLLTPGAKIQGGRLILDGKTGGLFAARDEKTVQTMAKRRTVAVSQRSAPPENLVLNYHLMHPGAESLPGDPNAAFCLDGVYHLHYILAHPWKDRRSFSFVHLTSKDLIHWEWQTTKLQPAFTGHGMFSGTGFLTKEGKPAAIYHGEGSGRNQIAIARDRSISAWEKPFPVEVKNPDGSVAAMSHWDPDCFLIGDTYYAISGGENPPLMKSRDLKTWTRVGDFLKHDMPDVAKGEDISCPQFFPLGNRWMLLCISHDLGCRYYLGDWDTRAERFVPQKHGRMNFRREGQSLFSRESWRVDFFAPESVLTPDGRRVMWAWLATIDRDDGRMSDLTIQSLPRELSLDPVGNLLIKPLRELESLRHEPKTVEQVELKQPLRTLLANRCQPSQTIADLGGDSAEVRITISRSEAERKLFGFTLFADGKGGGLPLVFRPETGTIRLGSAEAPFAVSDLPAGEDIEVRIFVDRYLVEVFVNGRQAMVGLHHHEPGNTKLGAFSIGAPTTLKKVATWKLKPANQGFRKAQKDRIWEPKEE